MSTLTNSRTMVFKVDSLARERGEFILTDWLRHRASSMGIRTEEPALDEVKQAVEAHLEVLARRLAPYLADPTSASDWLQHFLGVVVIVELGGERIGWTAIEDPDSAQAMYESHTNPAYIAARKQLGITQLWIWQIDPDYLPSSKELVKGSLGISPDRPAVSLLKPL